MLKHVDIPHRETDGESKPTGAELQLLQCSASVCSIAITQVASRAASTVFDMYQGLIVVFVTDGFHFNAVRVQTTVRSPSGVTDMSRYESTYAMTYDSTVLLYRTDSPSTSLACHCNCSSVV